jgi:protease I
VIKTCPKKTKRGDIKKIVSFYFYHKDYNKFRDMENTQVRKKRVLMAVAFRDFRDEEYFTPKRIFEEEGFQVDTASNKIGAAIGTDGGEANADFLFSEIISSNFDALIFVGGPGCLKSLDNEDSYRLAKSFVLQNKVLGAICIAPVILSKAGILIGKKATVWSSSMDKSAIGILQERGAVYQNSLVVVNGKIITANGPDAAELFGKEIVKALTSE